MKWQNSDAARSEDRGGCVGCMGKSRRRRLPKKQDGKRVSFFGRRKTMNDEEALKAGWKSGDAADFLGMTVAEKQELDVRVS
jgi:hypothetical protein